MKKISEVRKITGVTRRTLQEWDKIGLLHPSAKTDSNYWLYNDQAINRITAIQVLMEVGYKRKEILKLLQTPPEDIRQVYDSAISKLEEKKKRIQGMINYMKGVRKALDLPENVLMGYLSVNPEKLLDGKPFSEKFEEIIVDMAETEIPNQKDEYYELSANIQGHLIAIGSLNGKPVDSVEVKKCVSELECVLEFWVPLLVEDLEMPEKDRQEIIRGMDLTWLLEEWIGDPEYADTLRPFCEDEAIDYIAKAIRWYIENYDSKEEQQ